MRIYLHESSARCPWSREINGKHIFVTISATWMNILLIMVSLIVFRTYTYICYGIKMKTTDRWQLIQRWWRHQMETFFALLALYEGNSPVTGESLSPHTHKGQWRRALMFSLICAWTNGWANHRDAGDLRRHRALWRHCTGQTKSNPDHFFGVIVHSPPKVIPFPLIIITTNAAPNYR